MTDERRHLSFEQLNNLVDGRVAADERSAVEAHLALCDHCAAERARLDSLLAGVRALPESIDPPPALLSAVHTRIAATTQLGRARRHWLLAAAAVLLVSLSSGITALLVRRSTVVVVRHDASLAAATRLGSPAGAVVTDYQAVIRELDETLSQRRAQLDPATIAKVEASLRVIDEAIGEAQRALAADPANLTLLDLLAASYERKLELLRRASELPATI